MSKSIPDHDTVFQAEVVNIMEYFRFGNQNDYCVKRDFFTASRAAIGDLSGNS